MKSKIAIPYEVIRDRLEQQSFKGRLSKGDASQTLTFIFRMPRQKITSIFAEMCELDLIRFEKNTAGRFILLDWENVEEECGKEKECHS